MYCDCEHYALPYLDRSFYSYSFVLEDGIYLWLLYNKEFDKSDGEFLTSMLLKVKYFGTSRLVESKLLGRAASIIVCNILLELLDPEDGGITSSKSQYLFLYDTA